MYDPISVSTALVSSGGDLLIELTDGTIINAGRVRGNPGPQGEPANKASVVRTAKTELTAPTAPNGTPALERLKSASAKTATSTWMSPAPCCRFSKK